VLPQAKTADANISRPIGGNQRFFQSARPAFGWTGFPPGKNDFSPEPNSGYG